MLMFDDGRFLAKIAKQPMSQLGSKSEELALSVSCPLYPC
jgi:hypothetical protein